MVQKIANNKSLDEKCTSYEVFMGLGAKWMVKSLQICLRQSIFVIIWLKATSITKKMRF